MTLIEFVAGSALMALVIVSVWALANDRTWENRYVALIDRKREEVWPTWTSTTTTTIINKPRKRRHFRQEVY